MGNNKLVSFTVENHPVQEVLSMFNRPYQPLRSAGFLFVVLLLPTLYELTGNSAIRTGAMIEGLVIMVPTIILATAIGSLVVIAIVQSKVGGWVASLILLAIGVWIAYTPASRLEPAYPNFHLVASLYVAGAIGIVGIFASSWIPGVFERFHVLRTREETAQRRQGPVSRNIVPSQRSSVVRGGGVRSDASPGSGGRDYR